jgi:hypothetical protein
MAISFKKLGKGIVDGLGKSVIKDIPEEAMENQTFYGRLIGKQLTPGGLGLLTLGTMGVSTVNNVLSSDRIANLGHVSVADNLDRLISYDGSGFIKRVNEVAGGDPAIMKDIVENAFDEPNQFGATGSIVFALHNMREG